MCNLDVNQSGSDENYLTKTTTEPSKVRPSNIYRTSSSNLDNIISTSRMVIMTDYTKNRPRKIILDTGYDNSKNSLHKNKESQLLFEIVFGNFNLSSKANGFKLHIIKNPSKMIVSKIFKTPFNAVYYENKTNSRKISPDSGNNHSSSSTSSHNSNMSRFSSYHSLNSCSTNNHHHSHNPEENGHFSPPMISRPNSTGCQRPSTTPNSNELNKNSDYFFNANYDMYHKSAIMMSIIFTFSIPDENRAEFEEFIFHYYVLLESILNRLSQLISDNCYNIYNGRLVNCWKQSKKWLISLLPRQFPEMFLSNWQGRCSKPTNISTNSMNIRIFEEVLEYFDRAKRIRFLAQIITGVLLTNENCAVKFFNGSVKHLCPGAFPYKNILQNLGINIRNHTFNRIIVKEVVKDKFQDQVSSWKDRLSSSLKFYKNIIHTSNGDQRNSYSELDLPTSSPINYIQPKNHSTTMNVVYKEMELLTEFIAHLLRPISTISYQLHILPIEATISESKLIRFHNNATEIEIPLINDGVILDKEILPQINEIFYPNKIADRIFPSITPLQGLVQVQNNNSNETFLNQLLMESRQSEITYNDQVFHPDFLIIDTETSSVNIRDNAVLPSSWVERILHDLISLTKLRDYSSVIGEMYLISALNDFSSKAKLCKDYLCENQVTMVHPWLMTQYGLTDSDMELILSLYN